MKIFEFRTKCSTISCERRGNRKFFSRVFHEMLRVCESESLCIHCLQCLFIEIETNKDFLEFPLTRCFSFKIIYLPELCFPKTCQVKSFLLCSIHLRMSAVSNLKPNFSFADAMRKLFEFVSWVIESSLFWVIWKIDELLTFPFATRNGENGVFQTLHWILNIFIKFSTWNFLLPGLESRQRLFEEFFINWSLKSGIGDKKKSIRQEK